MLEHEYWSDVPGYEGSYQASTHGRILSLHRVVPCSRWGWRTVPERMLITTRLKLNGNVSVVLFREGERREISVGRVILKTFSYDMPDPWMAVHTDGDPTNNHLHNLEWGLTMDQAYNRSGLATRKLVAAKKAARKLSVDQMQMCMKAKGVVFQKVLAEKFGVSQATISNIQIGKGYDDVPRV